VTAERAFLSALGGGCNVPLGAHAFEAAAEVELAGFVASSDGCTMLRGEARGSDPIAVGRELARLLLDRGAGPLLDAAGHSGR
jgi:hydroxymethylbilane synthase